jgi:hypothetical protein
MNALIPALFGNGQRKFILAVMASASAGALCWAGHLSGAEWVTAQTLLLGLYGSANVIDKRMGGAG